MNDNERLANVAVLGAAGKMGSGILLLAATQITDIGLQNGNAGQPYVVHAIDMSNKALQELMRYIREQTRKLAEKKLIRLRQQYAERDDIAENGDVIQAYINDVMDKIKPSTRLEAAYDATLIFEAVSENPDLKVKLFKQIDKNNNNAPWFFTNTSSIPIEELNKKSELEGRIIGFHFYNPPAVQKLVEIIEARSTLPQVAQFAHNYAAALKKVVVPSNDIAGFIGNGYLMRDALFGIQLAEKLHKTLPFPQAVFVVDTLTRDFLIRPMGIFQLIDYVGIDVVQYIMEVMNSRLDDALHSELLDTFMQKGVTGGQYGDGSQKDGFFRYEKGKPVAAYNPEQDDYVVIETFKAKAEAYTGPVPKTAIPWKKAIKDPDSADKIAAYFRELQNHDSEGAKLALQFAANTKAIGEKLVKDKVAYSVKDVNTVLRNGFFHAFDPVSDFIPGK